MREQVKVGMISYAHIHAEFRSRALTEIPQATIVAIADDNEKRGHFAAKKFRVNNFYLDYHELLKRDDIDIVFIHSENNRHTEMAVAAAEAGKDIFCEKPMATTLEDADKMLEAVKKYGVSLTLGFCSRFIPEAERAKKIINSGVLGDIICARAIIGLAGVEEIGCPSYMTRWITDPKEGGGGALIDEGSHAVDLFRWLVGEIKSVSAITGKIQKKQLNVEDQAVAWLRFSNGALGELNTSWSLNIDVGMRNVVELYGSEGSLFIELTSKTPCLKLYTEKAVPNYLAGWINPHIKPPVTEPHDYTSWPTHVQHYYREVSRFIDSYIKKDADLGPTGEDGRAALEIILACYESAKKGTVVSLPYYKVLKNHT